MSVLSAAALPILSALAASVFIGGLIALLVVYGFAARSAYRDGVNFRRAWRDNVLGFGFVWLFSVLGLLYLFYLFLL